MKQLVSSVLALATSALITAQAQDGPTIEERLKDIAMPEGFAIEVFIEDLPNPRQMALGKNGTVFVGTRQAGSVYAVVDEDGDYKADKVHEIISKRNKLADGTRLNLPNGVAYKDGSLWVAASDILIRFDDIESKLENPGDPVIVANDIPKGESHFWKYIGFGPDEKLYIPSGAPCDICPEQENRMIIMRMDADAKNRETIAFGVRNTLGFDWNPETDELWFTEHGADHLGQDAPPDELNRLSEVGEHFGFPYIHGKDIVDPSLGHGHEPSMYTAPVQELVPHAGVMGMKFYTGDMFPAEYKNAIFLTEKSGHRGDPLKSQRVAIVKHDNEKSLSYEPFATGWRVGDKPWGKPVDVLVLPDGSMLISDDTANAIYRITYKS